jgi:glycerophosphoryl diester phosphodiesterase
MPNGPLILGHRGASAVAPENTLAAFSRALAAGADGIEFDVRLSRDGVPVVIHDASLKRTGMVDRLVSELSGDELQEIDVGSWFSKRGQNASESFRGEKLPTLAQVLKLFSGNSGLLYVEMKSDSPDVGLALAAEVVKLVREFRSAERVVVESFDHAAIAAVKLIDLGIRTAALFEPALRHPLSTMRRLKMVDAALAVGADEIALHHSLAAARVVEKAAQAGLAVVVWTVDEAIWLTRARSLGIKALIANDPAFMLCSTQLDPYENGSR